MYCHLVRPMIKIHSTMVGGYKNSFAILQCIIEAFPPAVNYWERHDGRLVQETNFGHAKGKVMNRNILTIQVLTME